MYFFPEKIIVNSEVTLEKLSSKHAKPMFAQIEQHRDYLSHFVYWTNYTSTLADSQFFITRCEQEAERNKSFVWAVLFQDQFVGTLSFNPNIDWDNKQVYLGYWLSPEVQGKGIITQSILKLIKETKQVIKQYNLKCAVHNQRSNAVAIRCGFQFDYCKEKAEQIGEQLYDQNIYKLVP